MSSILTDTGYTNPPIDQWDSELMGYLQSGSVIKISLAGLGSSHHMMFPGIPPCYSRILTSQEGPYQMQPLNFGFPNFQRCKKQTSSL